MRAEEKNRLAGILREEYAALQASIQVHAGAAGDALQQGEIGAVEVPIEAALIARAKENLQRVERNLADLERPDFGLCEQCDQPIPLQRLILLPAARLCVHCAARSEQGRN